MKVKALALAASVAVVLSSCSVSINSRPNKPTPLQSSTTNTRYLNDIRDRYPELGAESDKSLVKLGRGVCAMLDRGASGHDLVNNILKVTQDPHDTKMFGYINGAGINYFCPKYRDKVASDLTDSSV